MKIYVCVKHVPDSAARITIVAKNQIAEDITFLLNPYDENAVEEAVRLKEQTGNSEIIAVTLGKQSALNTLQAALAMGADRAILVKTDNRPDSIMTARALKAAIELDGKPDIIFTGKESIDGEGMQTMFRLAAAMGLPVATNAVAFALAQDHAAVESDLEAGVRQELEIPLPCVIGTGKGLNTPRYPTFMDIRNSKKKEIRQIDMDDLGIEAPPSSMEVLELEPSVEQRQPKEIKGTPLEMVRQLIEVLRQEAKVI